MSRAIANQVAKLSRGRAGRAWQDLVPIVLAMRYVKKPSGLSCWWLTARAGQQDLAVDPDGDAAVAVAGYSE